MPAVLFNRKYVASEKSSGQAVPLMLGLERENGLVSRFETVVRSGADAETLPDVVRIVKFFGWSRMVARQPTEELHAVLGGPPALVFGVVADPVTLGQHLFLDPVLEWHGRAALVVAQASCLCVSARTSPAAGTHRQDACATMLPAGAGPSQS